MILGTFLVAQWLRICLHWKVGSIPVQQTTIPHAMKPLNSQAITTKPAQPKLKKIKIQLLVHIPH